METEVNIPLLRKVVEWAEAEAAKGLEHREWEQAVWVMTPDTFDNHPLEDPTTHTEYLKATDCGTCYCIAGKVVAETLRPGETMTPDLVVHSDGTTTRIPDRAAEELGIPYDPDRFIGAELFDPENTIETVRLIAEDLAGERL